MVSEEKTRLSAREIAFQKRRAVRKPQANSKLDYLSEEQHAKLCEWMLTPNLGYYKILERLQNEFGIHSHCQALTHFWRKHIAAHQIAARRKTLGLAEEINKDIKEHPGNYTQSTIDALEVRTHDCARDPNVSIKDLNLLTNMCLRYRAQVVAELKANCKLRELAMAERREKRATETLKDSALNPEQKFQRLREIFRK